jgi:hypothetical protein
VIAVAGDWGREPSLVCCELVVIGEIIQEKGGGQT